MDDLVKRLRDECEDAADPIYMSSATLLKAADRIEALEKALEDIAECDVPREHITIFRNDGVLSKHDKCKHDRVMYEDCELCISDYARAALGEKKE